MVPVNSQVDLDSEAQIVEAIDRLAQGRTVLTVSHRAGALTTADRVVRVADGGVDPVSPESPASSASSESPVGPESPASSDGAGGPSGSLEAVGSADSVCPDSALAGGGPDSAPAGGGPDPVTEKEV